ncbi:MAG TPA: HAD family hydrolase [Candidatus Saccharimonadales bacterium]|nr:HAD family hydrolase [Candidatus Saccharimonadales bacterium]
MHKAVTYEQLHGVIYDVDDTLLNNQPADGIPFNLHERSRLAAIHRVGQESGLEALALITPEENERAFLEAPEHTVDAAIWRLLHRYGIVDVAAINPTHNVLQKIIALKAELHMELLLSHGVEVAGASQFVHTLERNGLAGYQAIASGARLEEIQVFLGKYKLNPLFPRRRITARGDYDHPKPHQQPFERAFASLGLPDTAEVRARVAAFEDDPHGIASARKAGLYVCALTTRYPQEKFLESAYPPHQVAANFVEYAQLFNLPLETT